MAAGNADLDRRFLALMESGEFGPEELWAISFMLDLFSRTGRTRITTTYERLAVVMGISVRTLRNYLSALEQIPWLVVIRAKKGVVVALNLSVLGETPAVEEETDGNMRQYAADDGNVWQMAASGGDKGGAGGQVISQNSVWGYLLLGEIYPGNGVEYSTHPPARLNNRPPDAVECREMPPNAARCPEMPPNDTATNVDEPSPSRTSQPPDAAECREMPQSAAKGREMPLNVASSAAEVDENALDALLEAVGDAYLLSEAEARELLASASARGVEPAVVVAAALHTRWKVEREGGLKRPTMFLRRLLEKAEPERQVTEQALQEARTMLGIEDDGEDETANKKYIGGPYSHLIRH